MATALDRPAATLAEIGTSQPATSSATLAACVSFWLNDYPEIEADPDVAAWIAAQPHPLAGSDVVVWWDDGEGSQNPFCYEPEVRRREGCAPERLWSLIDLVCRSQNTRSAYVIIKGE